MWVGVWLALAVFATLWTVLWVVGHDRIYVKAGFALASWATVAISAGDLYSLTDTGSEVQLAVPAIQYLTAGLAVLSFVVMLLYRFDMYPPRTESFAVQPGD